MSEFIRGDRPNGIFTTTSRDGVRIQGETRQCVHCQYMWQHKPGSGRRYGVCGYCDGIMCARPVCIAMQKKRLDRIGDPSLSCVTHQYLQYWLLKSANKLEKNHGKLGQDFVMTSAGFAVPRRPETLGPNFVT